MKLIENWASHLWRAWSVRLAYLATVPGIAWPLIPVDMRDKLPPGLVTVYAVVAAASIVFARVLDQGGVKKPGGE